MIVGFISIFFKKPSIKKEAPELKFLFVDVNNFGKKIGINLVIYMAQELVRLGHNELSLVAFKNYQPSNLFYLHLGAQLLETNEIWLPYGTTPETYPKASACLKITIFF